MRYAVLVLALGLAACASYIEQKRIVRWKTQCEMMGFSKEQVPECVMRLRELQAAQDAALQQQSTVVLVP